MSGNGSLNYSSIEEVSYVPEALETRSNKLTIWLFIIARSGVQKVHHAQILSTDRAPKDYHHMFL